MPYNYYEGDYYGDDYYTNMRDEARDRLSRAVSGMGSSQARLMNSQNALAQRQQIEADRFGGGSTALQGAMLGGMIGGAPGAGIGAAGGALLGGAKAFGARRKSGQGIGSSLFGSIVDTLSPTSLGNAISSPLAMPAAQMGGQLVEDYQAQERENFARKLAAKQQTRKTATKLEPAPFKFE